MQLGLTAKDEKGLIAMPVDAMVFQELSFHNGSGCPHTLSGPAVDGGVGCVET